MGGERHGGGQVGAEARRRRDQGDGGSKARGRVRRSCGEGAATVARHGAGEGAAALPSGNGPGHSQNYRVNLMRTQSKWSKGHCPDLCWKFWQELELSVRT